MQLYAAFAFALCRFRRQLKANSLIGIDVTVLSVCLSLTFVHFAQTAEDINTISFTYDSSMSLPDHVKIWLTSVNPPSPNFAPKWPTTVD